MQEFCQVRACYGPCAPASSSCPQPRFPGSLKPRPAIVFLVIFTPGPSACRSQTERLTHVHGVEREVSAEGDLQTPRLHECPPPTVKEPSSHGTRGCSGCGSQTPHQGIGLSLDTLGKDLCEANANSGPLSSLIGAILTECGLAIGLDIRKCCTDTEGPRQGPPESPGMPGSWALCLGSLCLSFYFAFSLTPAL